MPVVVSDRTGENGFSNYLRKFGRAASLSNGTEVVMWDGNNTAYDGWLANEEDIQIVSDSVEDAAEGTGCQYIQFSGQGEDGIQKTYSMTLNGTTPVLLSDTDPGVLFDIIYTAQCLNIEGTNLLPTAEDGAANTGTITISAVTTGKTMAIIQPNKGRTQMMVYRVPADKYGKFRRAEVFPSDAQPFVARIMARASKLHSWLCMGEIDCDNYSVALEHTLPDYLPAGADICLVIVAGSNGADCSAQMWIELEDIED